MLRTKMYRTQRCSVSPKKKINKYIKQAGEMLCPT